MKKIPDKITFIICQFNFVVGDIPSNEAIIRKQIEKYHKKKNCILVFPELALSGYSPLDQLYYQDFHSEIENAIENIRVISDHNAVIFGSPRYDASLNLVFNCAYVLQNKKIVDVVDKSLLPNYNVFHERRYFYPGEPKIINLFGLNIGLQICEDMWDDRPEHSIKVTHEQTKLGADFFINISSSPFTARKPLRRLNVVKNHIKQSKSPFVYVNIIGSQDEVVFDGRSFVVDKNGDMIFSAEAFLENDYSLDFDLSTGNFVRNEELILHEDFENVDVNQNYEEAIKLSLRDYITKNHLPSKVIVALSGGIDSALTATLAKLALGSENVLGIYLPTHFSSSHSEQDAKQLAENLGIEFYKLSIEELNLLFSKKLHEDLDLKSDWSLADENLQARIRGVILMYLSNKLSGLVLSTGNKSEIACGYTTLYGDSIGGKNLIGDLFKTEVYLLATHINKKYNLIPQSSITKPPSAELRENQKDSDSLPEYEVLDPILKLYIEKEKSRSQIIELGHNPVIVDKVLRLMRINEFKRSQMCQTVNLKRRSFGIGRIFPISSQFRN